jgi:putative ABC transport system substrate-binding protein
MKRRQFVALVGGAVAWPAIARAQRGAMPVIGFLSARSPDESEPHLAFLLRGLNEAGFVEGQNVSIDYRWADGHYDRLSMLASELIARRVNVIAAIADPAPQIVRAATNTIPIVFAINGDPVRDGLVASLNQPGGNATGITIFGPDAVTKRVQLLHELVPQVGVIAYVANPNNAYREIEITAARSAARALGKEMLVLSAGTDGELDVAIASPELQRVGALLVASDASLLARRGQLVRQVARLKKPAIYYVREFAEAGGLMSYGNKLADVYRQVGLYVGRILKGEKPADLPVQLSTKFELVINLKTANTLGLEIPPTLLVLADEVIE